MANENVDPNFLGAGPAPNARKKKKMTEAIQVEALSTMMAVNEDGRFPHGAMKKFSPKLGVARSTLWRLWKKCAASRAQGRVLTADTISRKKTMCGAKAQYDEDEVIVALKQIPLWNRRTLRSTAMRLGVSLATVQRLKKKKSYSAARFIS